MIALAAALLLLSQDTTEGPNKWAHIEVGNWTYHTVSASGDMLAFYQAASQRGRLWTRYEMDAGPYRSRRTLIEVNCAEGRSRFLQTITFTESNLRGDGVSINGPGEWSYVAPDTIGEAELHVACGD